LNRVYFSKPAGEPPGADSNNFFLASKELSRLNEPLPVGPTPSGQQAFFVPLIS